MKSSKAKILVLSAIGCVGIGVAIWRFTGTHTPLPDISPRTQGGTGEFLNAQRAAG